MVSVLVMAGFNKEIKKSLSFFVGHGWNIDNGWLMSFKAHERKLTPRWRNFLGDVYRMFRSVPMVMTDLGGETGQLAAAQFNQ